MRENIDPNTIEDEGVRQIVITLMNLVETLSAKVTEQAEEIRRLRDEIRRLKGEQSAPTFTPKPASALLSSEKERHQPTPHRKAHKHAQVKIDRTEVVTVEKHLLPDDAQFKGYEEVVVQDMVFRTDNVRFRKERYYSPSQKKTYLAALPPGYHGQFGPGVKAWVLALYYADGMSEPNIMNLLHTIGMSMSAGQLSALLIKDQEIFHAESAAVRTAGLASSPWQHLDSTGTTVNGKLFQCHILCNSLYTSYTTLPGKDRMSMLRVLQGGADPLFHMNALALELLKTLGVAAIWHGLLSVLLPSHQISTESQLDLVLDRYLPAQGTTLRTRIKEALAIAAYQTQTISPVVKLLLCDHAPQFNCLTAQLALCWIHEYRHYKKLTPRFLVHIDLLADFSQKFWTLYRRLLDYRNHPCPQEAQCLKASFEQLFGEPSGYQQLDERKASTLRQKDALLMVLSHPEILLHNNPAELGARQRVRKRDVSLQARTADGIHAWDSFQTLVETAKKLGVNIAEYFHDRISRTYQAPALATLIQERSLELHLGDSWSLTT